MRLCAEKWESQMSAGSKAFMRRMITPGRRSTSHANKDTYWERTMRSKSNLEESKSSEKGQDKECKTEEAAKAKLKLRKPISLSLA